MANSNIKRKQLSLSQHKEQQAKQGQRKLIPDFPKPVLLILTIPFVIFITLLLGYIFYIRNLSTH